MRTKEISQSPERIFNTLCIPQEKRYLRKYDNRYKRILQSIVQRMITTITITSVGIVSQETT